MIFLGAAHKDNFRKPNTGMWDYLEEKFLGGKGIVDKSQSLFCGDAAGCQKTALKAKDFSADDLLFVRNVGVQFHTPESLFLEFLEDQKKVTDKQPQEEVKLKIDLKKLLSS